MESALLQRVPEYVPPHLPLLVYYFAYTLYISPFILFIMSPIENTPPEILSHILSCLANKDLFSTSLVSHRWGALSQPLLYQNPLLITSGETESLYGFARTLVTPGRGLLASHVRSLVLNYPACEQGYPKVAINSFTAAAAKIGLDYPLASVGSLVILLMHLLPSLRILSVTPQVRRDVFDIFIEAHQTPQPMEALPLAFQNLHEFNWFSDRYCGISPAMLLAILQLPRMRVIRVDLIEELDKSFPAFGTAEAIALSGTSPVTHISFPFINISPSSLKRILVVPHALKYFSYHMPCDQDFGLSDIRQALQPLQRSLCYLHLEFFLLHDDVLVSSIGSLRDWPELRCVRCSLATLLGGDIANITEQLAYALPRRLHALEIIHSDRWTAAAVVDVVVNMLDQKGALLPGLRRLAVRYNWHLDREQLGRLIDACKTVDVEFIHEGTELVEDGRW